MAKFAHGDKVNVKLDAVGTVEWVGTDKYDVRFDSGPMVEFIPESAITRAEPESWPPRVGDVWQAECKLYGVRHHSFAGSFVLYPVAKPVGGVNYCSRFTDGKSLDDFKALNPTLVKRQDAS